MRSLSTAQALAWASWKVEFLSSVETGITAPAIQRAGIPIRSAAPDDLSATDTVVFDHYDLDAASERSIAGDRPRRVAFDDMPSRRHDVDILLDPTPGRVGQDYAAYVRNDTLVLAGAPYAQLSRGWIDGRAIALENRRSKATTRKRVLVSMGATDPNNATQKILPALADLDVEIDVVLGQSAPHLGAVRNALGHRGRLHVDPPDFPALVAEADIAVGAAGSSCFERACLGLPSLVIVLADNQRDLAKAFEKQGAVQVIEFAKLVQPSLLAQIVVSLLSDERRLSMMSDCGSDLVDGRGTQRFLTVLAGQHRVGSHIIALRLAEKSDSDWLLDLQSTPDVRRFSLNPEVPTASEHALWFAGTLANPDRLLAIVRCDGKPSGMLRIDRSVGPTVSFQVSIAVSPEFQRKGIGLAALSALRQVVPSADLKATVLPDNLSSQKLFVRAGYGGDGDCKFVNHVS